MNSFVTIIAYILVYDAVSPISAQLSCGLEDTLLPNPIDCGSYYQCEPNGLPKLRDCAPDHNGGILVFNPLLQVCVFPASYDCQIFACHRYNDRDTCLSSPNNCSYCCDSLDDGTPMCGNYDNLLEAGCKAFERLEYDKNVDANTSCISMPPGKRNITITFSREKHPLDLYYLLDTTGSMADDKDNLVLLSSRFIAALNNLTDDFRVGIGTFKDKPIFPSNRDDYSFHNDLPLTNKAVNFIEQVEAVKISGGGGDGPEALSDALPQVVECPSQIGWRENTRRVILAATDDYFHVAGFGGPFNITAPYVDGCYLDSQGFYTETLTMDFPSIEQIASAYSKAPATTVIFAATSPHKDFYENVASQLKSAYVGVLATDSSNIVELINDEFARIDSKIKIEKSDTSDTVRFKYFSNCMGSDGERETTICENIPPDGEVSFTVEIDFPECPIDNDETGMDIDFSPVGLPISIEVKLKFLCD